jgi:hypothetical protein
MPQDVGQRRLALPEMVGDEGQITPNFVDSCDASFP